MHCGLLDTVHAYEELIHNATNVGVGGSNPSGRTICKHIEIRTGKSVAFDLRRDVPSLSTSKHQCVSIW